MQYWLMKSEPSVYGIADLERDGVTGWEGVRNYQARNFMRDRMAVGDLALFYHSNATPPGVVGLMRVVKAGYADDSATNPASPYYDERTGGDAAKNPWVRVDVVFVGVFPVMVNLGDLRDDPVLAGLLVTQKGSRLSVQPVERAHFEHICRLGGERIMIDEGLK